MNEADERQMNKGAREAVTIGTFAYRSGWQVGKLPAKNKPPRLIVYKMFYILYWCEMKS